MDMKKFFELLDDEPEMEADEFVSTVREQLDAARHRTYLDVNGDGTLYTTSGTGAGIGYAKIQLEVLPENRVKVKIETGQKVAAENEPALRKLFYHYNDDFLIPGLAVEDGRVIFESAPLDPVNGPFDADSIVGKAMTTVHAYAGVSLALEAGVAGWKLLGYNDDDNDDGDVDDGDGGTPFGLHDMSGAARRFLAEHTMENLADREHAEEEGNEEGDDELIPFPL